VFRKNADGTLPLRTLVVHFPYLAANWSLWHIHRSIARETPKHELLPGVWIGRRLLEHELPAEFEQIIDLTCEFPEPRGIRTRLGYRFFPILDGGVAPAAKLVEMLCELNAQDAPVYIHCAGGKGRTGLAAAVLVLIRGEAETAEDAIAFARRQRGLVALSRSQKRVVEDAARIWREMRSAEGEGAV
jgi:hypothetical protein